MTVHQLLRALYEAKITIRREGTQILLNPRERVTPEMAEAVTEHREALLWVLARRCPDHPLHEVWISGEIYDQWMYVSGAYRAA